MLTRCTLGGRPKISLAVPSRLAQVGVLQGFGSRDGLFLIGKTEIRFTRRRIGLE